MPSIHIRLFMISFAVLACIGCSRIDKEVVKRKSSAVDSFEYKPDPKLLPNASREQAAPAPASVPATPQKPAGKSAVDTFEYKPDSKHAPGAGKKFD
jgi:hypothetical protein